MSFIEQFMESASKNAESPRSYFYWSALCAISAVVKRNVWIERPTWKTYPNIFVFLVGESGLRKGVPISLAKDLVAAVNNTRIISGRSSLPGIISYLGTAYTIEGKNGEPPRVIDKAYGYISSSEFSSSIVRDPDSLTILTDLYDSCYHDKWIDTLRGGKVELIEPSITLLAGINPPHFEDYISPTAVSGGFVGRLLLVFESEKACVNPAIRVINKEDKFDKSPLVTMLKAMSQVKGQMQFENEETIKFYEDWYFEFEENRKQKKYKDKTGSINRVGENVLKVAILLSLSRKPDLIISKEDISEALKACTTSLSNVNKTTTGQGKSQFAPQTKLVLTELAEAKDYEISRTKLLSRNYGDIDATDLDRVIDTLHQAGAIIAERKGTDIYYRLTPAAIKQMQGK